MDDAAALARGMTGCELVFHAAGAVGFGNDWAGYFRTNVQGTVNVLEAARQAGVRRVIHTSSVVAVGGSATPVCLDENAAWNLQAIRVPYVYSKRRAEQAALRANGEGLEVVVANPASVVGPNDHTNSEFGDLCKAFWKGRIPFHFGGGNNFVDVRDVACGLLLAAERGRPGERYLLAGEDRTYIEFFSDLCRAARRTIPRLRLPNALAWWVGRLNEGLRGDSAKRPFFTSAQAALMGRYFFFDSSKAHRELGYVARPLRESLADAYRFWSTPSRRRALIA
jgi:dihydroflavonol-4-reductase